ncbi:MAG: insulinase family protein [Firmicutes bacterium]|nr:insulinase family protein [Bacillota bacterium]
MKTTTYSPIQETLIETTLSSGMRVIFLPKKDFSRVAVSLQIKFGSTDQFITLKKTKEQKEFYEGTAHFLEHMIFENEQNDVSKAFSLLGASVNAYTTSNRTSYYFSTTNPVVEPLKLLLDTVFNPTLHEDAILKEKAIIQKEITMYQDDLDQSLYYDLLHQMYKDHPIKNDVAGSEESLLLIHSELLRNAFYTFYHPKNTLLVITGDVNQEEVFDFLKNYQFLFPFKKHQDFIKADKLEAVSSKKKSAEIIKDVVTDLVMIGILIHRDAKLSPQKAAIEEISLLLLLDNYLGKSSPNYQELNKKQLINSTFDYSASSEETYGHIILYTETKKPKQSIKEMESLLTLLQDYQIDSKRFIIQKRKLVGQFVQIFNSITQTNNFIAEYALRGMNAFTFLSILEKITENDLYGMVHYFQENAIVSIHYHK